jgi:hypothetical protein
MPAKVWIVGEGNNELGVGDGYGKRGRGVLEALLASVCEGGWECSGKLPWRAIQKFRAGGARLAHSNHGDYFNVQGLVLAAYEAAADAVAFSRDVDSDPDREDAVAMAIAWIREESSWQIGVIGGIAKPAIEGWILALRGIPGTDAMSRSRVSAQLTGHEVEIKSTNDYIDVIEQARVGESPNFGLPSGAESLCAWLAMAHEILNGLVHGRVDQGEQTALR